MVVVVRVELDPGVLQRSWRGDSFDACRKLFVQNGEVCVALFSRFHHSHPKVLPLRKALELAREFVGVNHFDDLAVGQQVDLLDDRLVQFELKK